ncbi:PH domain-containing protein [Clostridium aquiflavi]|uniref:PH domain-containing protein n=1 Tax=Clostridium aquiflavi TaxID=3073603 RepID=A0ABU1EDJ6_9CLOT|nr:PH domain-containing protein [Clostridium sp. 5N-1]MDR5586443.1 PH domain-containing protein [Clostridium sp. 5N-1]
MRKTEIYRGHWSNIIKSIISNIYLIFILLFALIKIKEDFNFIIWTFAIGFFIVLYSILLWRSKYFYIEDNMFVYVKGMIEKTKEQIPLKQITTVDLKTTILDRILGSVTLKLNSGNATLNEAEFELVVKKEYALLIQKAVSGQDVNEEDVYSNVKELQVEYKDIAIYALTKNKFGWIMALFIIGNKFSKVFKKSVINNAENYLESAKDYILNGTIFDLVLKLLFIFAFIYVFSTIISIGIEILKYGNFKIIRSEDSFNIRYGTIDLKEYSISLEKIQGLKLKQNLLQQLLDLYKIEAIVIGDDETNSLLFPSLKGSKKDKFINEFLPEYKITKDIDKASKKSIFRFIFKRFIVSIVVSLILILLTKQFLPKLYMINSFKFILSLTLCTSQIILGYIDYLNNGIAIEENNILLTNGSRIKNTYIIRKFKVQSLQVKQSILQRYRDICNYKIDIATSSFGETIEIKNMDIKKYEEIL